MTDYSELKRLAEAAEEQGAAWEKAGRPWPVWNSRLQDFRIAAKPASVLALISDVEYLRLELSGVETAKQDLAEILGCADEPRWKWLHCNASSLKAENEALRKDAERYRAVRRVANGQGYSDEQFDQQTDERTARFDAAMAKERGQ